jgi:NAD(P)-dependent dehydrogenase (short-subunit alcohol dehydrogenase family)
MANYLIIGGSSGIGQAVVKALDCSENRIYASYFSGENLTKLPNVIYFHHDVRKAFPSLDFLPNNLDGLVYCPGAIDLKPFGRISPSQFIDDYDLQVVGAIRVIQGVLPLMTKENLSSIVLFSTVAVQMGYPFHSKVSASKGAIEGLTKALAAEFAPKIRINAIAPSLTETPLAARLLNTEEKKNANALRHPLKRIGKVEDLANITEFLLSPKSSWITGQIIHVDGGMSQLNVG